jgi:hypothetical protein
MKRSQALALIMGALMDYDSEGCFGLALAEDILDSLTEAGMKPPVEKRCPVLLTNVHIWDKE